MKATRILPSGAIAAAVVAFALAGCAPASPTPFPAADATGTWGVDTEGEPQLVLGPDGSLTGTDGCNRLTGQWAQTGSSVEFGEVASTRRYCADIDTWLADLASATVSTRRHQFEISVDRSAGRDL